jgi:hypothetical protein
MPQQYEDDLDEFIQLWEQLEICGETDGSEPMVYVNLDENIGKIFFHLQSNLGSIAHVPSNRFCTVQSTFYRPIECLTVQLKFLPSKQIHRS